MPDPTLPCPETPDTLRQELDSLERLRPRLGETQYQALRAEIEARLDALRQPVAPPAAPATSSVLDSVLQTRQVQVSQDASGNVIITGDHNQLTLAPDQAPAEHLRAYYRRLAAVCSRLPLGVVSEAFAAPGEENPVTLHQVYTDLDVVSPPRPQPEEGAEQQRWFGLRLERGEGGERLALLSALAQPEARCLVLLGLPGSGKTTFVNYLTACLAGGQVPADLPEVLRSSPYLARLALRYAAPHIPLEARQGTARMLWDALEADIAEHCGQAAAGLVLPYLQRRLEQQGGLVLLDGLDEVPEAGARRQRLLEAVRAWQRDLPRCRFLLTARPYADPGAQLPGFQSLALAPFNQRQVQNFIERWYAAVHSSVGCSASEGQQRAGELLQALSGRSYLADLASRPLLLTLMATLHSHKRKMPEDRADLYKFAVDLLLERWEVDRQVRDLHGNLEVDEGIGRVLGLGGERLRQALATLALQTHTRQGQSAVGRQEAAEQIPADIPLGDILAVFSQYTPNDLNPRLVVEYLEKRAGLLIGRGEEIYTFPHRSFQEYLAACRLADAGDDQLDFAQRLRDLVRADLDWWREVFLLGVGRQRQGSLNGAVHILNCLLPCLPEEAQTLDELHWRLAILAGEAALDLRLAENQAEEYHRALLERIRRWLVELLRRAALPPKERLQAGDLLGRLGDPRPGVGVRRGGRSDGNDLPDIDWVRIPAGAFWMGSAAEDEQAYEDEKPQHLLELPEFWIARYPTTNAQYRPFVKAGGYAQERYWTPEGWVWRTGGEIDLSPLESLIRDNKDEDMKDAVEGYKKWVLGRVERDQPYWWEDPQWGAPTRPVVGITWYEALAYCAWLDECLRGVGLLPASPVDYRVRLPGEAEWEKAARGPQRRGKPQAWPWGSRWQADCANTREAELNETSPVGCFPGGASRPYGLHDLAGNTWEWTLSKWGADMFSPQYTYPYQAEDGRQALPGSECRVVRGGSWRGDQRDARCAARFRNFPASFDLTLGFRVVLSLARSEC